MKMKVSAVWADGTFPSNIAPLMGSLKQCAREAARMGYEALSLTVDRPELVDVEHILSVLEAYKLSVSGLATGRIYTVDGLGLGMRDKKKRHAAVARMCAFVEICARLGNAKLIIGAIRGWVRDAGDRSTYEALFRDSLTRILEKAEPLGVELVLEAISRIDSDAYCSVAETAAFIRSFHSPCLKLQLDSIHLHTNEEVDFYQEILRAGDLVGQVDISDVDRMAPNGEHFDFPLLVKALEQIDYQEYLVFEFQAAPPEEAAMKGLQYIRSLMS